MAFIWFSLILLGSIFTLTTDLSIKPTVTNEQPDIGSTRQSQLETLKLKQTINID